MRRCQNVSESLLKKIIPFVNGYDQSTLSYKKELANKRVVVKVSVFVYIPVKFEAECPYIDSKEIHLVYMCIGITYI